MIGQTRLLSFLKKNFLNVTILYSETYKQKIDKSNELDWRLYSVF